MASIYDYPDVYDAVVRAPLEQIEAEVASIAELLARCGITGSRVLELGCGTCSHATGLARRGFAVTGLDLSAPMLAGARERAKTAGVELGLVLGDVTDFDLPGLQFDCVIFMAETFPVLADESDLRSHFAAVRRHLRPGGLYIVDVDAHKHGPGDAYGVWGERVLDTPVGRVEVWHEDFPGDWVKGVSRLVMHTRIHQGDSTVETSDEWHIRQDAPWHLELLLKTLPDWSLVGFYSWRDLSPDIASERHYFMVLA